LGNALQQNNIAVFSNFRVVAIGDNWFYQIKLPDENVLQYLSTQTGKKLKDGDALYARHLARQFLTGNTKAESTLLAAVATTPATVATSDAPEHDCCASAAAMVMTDTTGATVSDVELVENFNSEYKYINRLLPVYKVSFARADGIRIYVETWQDRFAFAMDNKRAVFDTFFAWFHTMSWLNILGNFKLCVEIILMLLAAATTIMGIYIFCISKTKKSAGNSTVKARNNHRWTSIIVSLFTLMFTLSGAFHAFEKLTPDDRDKFFVENHFRSAQMAFDFSKLIAAAGSRPITGISVVKINNAAYWQVNCKNVKQQHSSKKEMPKAGMMQSKTVPTPSFIYVNTTTYEVLADGEKKYAQALAAFFCKRPLSSIMHTDVITKFEGEYGFVNKRLPVWKISYEDNGNERLYVETSTGRLAAKVNDNDLWEGYSFAMLHKHHFMDCGGKGARDVSTMFWALAQVAMVAVGLVLWQRIRKKKNS
jgi:hypothetical protein